MARKHRHHQKRGGGSAWMVTDRDAANVLGNGHPKCSTPPTDPSSFPAGTTGAGSAPGANGPPTTGPAAMSSS